MTRDEAIKKVEANRGPFHSGFPIAVVDSLVALGLLHLETTEDTTRIAAAERLTNTHTHVAGDAGSFMWGKITRDGALEILDVLTKSGFTLSRAKD